MENKDNAMYMVKFCGFYQLQYSSMKYSNLPKIWLTQFLKEGAINFEFLMKPEGSAECDQTLFFWVGSGSERGEQEKGKEEEEGGEDKERRG